MPLEAKGTLQPRVTKTKGREDTRYYIYIPSELARDSAFPFELKKQPVTIAIDEDRLIVEKLGE